MSTDAHHPTSRITDALLPPAPAVPSTEADAASAPGIPGRPLAAPVANTAHTSAAPRPAQPPAGTVPSAPSPTAPATPGTAHVGRTAPPRPAAAPPVPRAAPAPPVDASGAPRRTTSLPAGPGAGRAAHAPSAPPRPAASPPVAPARPDAAPDPGRPVAVPASGRPVAVPPRPAAAPSIAPAGRPTQAGSASDVAPRQPMAVPRTAPAAGGHRPPGAVPSPRPVGPPPAADLPAVETTARLRPVRATEPPRPTPPRPEPTRPAHPRPAPTAHPHPAPTAHPRHHHAAYRPFTVPPESPAETTTRLRPIRERRTGRVVAAGICLVLGVGLVGGAVAGAVLAATDAGAAADPAGYEQAKGLWHDVPVDTLFPRTLAGPGAGPGGADRTWTRVVVAADAPCSAAVLQKSLLTAVQAVGCDRVLRATYTDATASSVVTVGLVFTTAEPEATRALADEQGDRIAADVPPALAAPGTVAARFGAAQRASWFTRPLADLPVVVTAVSGFADGRPVAAPEPAERAMSAGQTSAPAQAGLGHEAKGVADRVERGLRAALTTAAKEDGDR